MRSKSFKGMACSIAGALEAIGDRWAVLILRDLMFGLSKYEDLRRSTGVTHATLSDRLRHLEANELIDRRRYQSNPERYEYVPPRNSGMRVRPRRVLFDIPGGCQGARTPLERFIAMHLAECAV